MKKFYKSLLLAVALVAPAMSWAELKGSGTETDPYLLGTPEDLLEMRSVLKYGQMTHFKMTADINMAGITSWVPLNSSGSSEIAIAEGATAEEAAVVAKESCALGSDEEYTKYIGFDGDGHIISGLVCRIDQDQYREARGWSYKSFFGILAGYCRNVGFNGCVFVDNNMGGGLIAGYLGHPKYKDAGFEETVIENCYINGTVKETGTSYLGGLVGNVATKSKIVNNSVQVGAYGTSGAMVGGIAGRVSAELTLENIVISGNKQITSLNFAGGPDKDAFLAGSKPIPYPAVGGLFANRKAGAKLILKNICAPFQYLSGDFVGDGIELVATPFGPISNDDVFDPFDYSVLTSPWTQKYGPTTVENGAFNTGTPVNLSEDYSVYCWEGTMSPAKQNNILVNVSQGGEMTKGYIFSNNVNGDARNSAIYSMPRWYFGKTYMDGGTGTVEDPYLISSKTHLGNMYMGVSPYYVANFKLTQDIECGAMNYLPPLGWDGLTYTQSLVFDGNYKQIIDFQPNRSYEGIFNPYGVADVYYQSLFGIFAGKVKNLGMTGARVYGKDRSETDGLVDGAGIMCAYAGHGDAKNGAIFENCYVDGVVLSNSYAGGIFGTTCNANQKVEVNNCWSNVGIDGLSLDETLPTFAGSIGGRAQADTLVINNCVARGETIKGKAASGLISSKNDQAIINVTEAISWVGAIIGETEASATVSGEGKVTGKIYTFNGTTVNGNKVEGSKTAAELLAIAQAWTGWSSTKNNDGYPMICWEAGEPQPNGSVAPVVGDNVVVAYGGEGVIYVKGASVVYNMNGQVVYSGAEETVNVPAGLYIVKVGGNATKVAVK